MERLEAGTRSANNQLVDKSITYAFVTSPLEECTGCTMTLGLTCLLSFCHTCVMHTDVRCSENLIHEVSTMAIFTAACIHAQPTVMACSPTDMINGHAMINNIYY